MSITPIDMNTLRSRIKEVKSLDTVKTLNNAKRATAAAKQLAGIVSPLDLKLANSLAKRVKDLEVDTAKTKAPNWFVQQIDRIPWLKKLRLFAASSLDKTIEFFKNTAVAIDKVLDRIPGWKFVKKLTGKGIDILTKFINHPLVQKFLSIFGLIMNVFSIGSNIAQWKLVFQLQGQFEKFTSRVLTDLNRDYTKIINQVLPIKRQVEKLNKDLPNANVKIAAIEKVIPTIVRQNDQLRADIKSQNNQISTINKGLALAVTATGMNLAIGKVIQNYQLGKLRDSVAPYSSQLPQIKTQGLQIAKQSQQILDLQKSKGLTPQQLSQLNANTLDIKNLKASPVKLSPQQLAQLNSIPGLTATVNGLKANPAGMTPAQIRDLDKLKLDFNNLRNTPFKLPPGQIDEIARKAAQTVPAGRDGKDGLVSVIYQYLPGKPGKDGLNGKDATMDPQTKAQINAIFAETSGNKATQQAILTSAATTQTTVIQTQQSVGAIGRTIDALSTLNQAIDKKLTGFIKWAGLDRVYNILIVITNLMMIASLLKGTVDLVVTTIETGWSLFGFGLKDAEGNQLSLSTAISGSLRQGLEQIIGTENVNDLEVAWVKNNRIYQAASAIAWNVVSVVDQTRTLGEQTLGHLNKFANGAKDAGTVAEDAWIGHWSETPTAGPLGGLVNNLEQLSSKVAIAVMPISTIAGIKAETEQLDANRKNLATALEADDKKISDEIAASKPKVPATLTNMQLGKVTPNG